MTVTVTVSVACKNIVSTHKRKNAEIRTSIMDVIVAGWDTVTGVHVEAHALVTVLVDVLVIVVGWVIITGVQLVELHGFVTVVWVGLQDVVVRELGHVA